jgi:hypothetical protein
MASRKVARREHPTEHHNRAPSWEILCPWEKIPLSLMMTRLVSPTEEMG